MTEKCEFIDAEYAETAAADAACAPTLGQMCAWLGISRSGFYDWRSCPESATARRRNELRLLITRGFEESDGTTGTGGLLPSWRAGACALAWNWSAS